MIGDKEAFGKSGDDEVVDVDNGVEVGAHDENDQEEDNVPTEPIIDFENETNVNTDVDGGIDDEPSNEDEAVENDDEDQVNEDTNDNEMDNADAAEDDMM